MSESKKRKKLSIAASSIFEGCFLGFCLGILSSICSSVSLKVLGRPDFLIRPGWENTHAIFMAFGGIVAGALYGAVLLSIQNNSRCRISIATLFIITLLEASVFYVALDYISISSQNLNIHMLGHAVVFVVAIANALMLVKMPKKTEQAISKGRPGGRP